MESFQKKMIKIFSSFLYYSVEIFEASMHAALYEKVHELC